LNPDDSRVEWAADAGKRAFRSIHVRAMPVEETDPVQSTSLHLNHAGEIIPSSYQNAEKKTGTP